MEKIEHSPLGNKNIKKSIFRIQVYVNDKALTDFTNLFSPWNFEKNDEIIKRYLQ